VSWFCFLFIQYSVLIYNVLLNITGDGLIKLWD
jgi:hypothetical protein